LLGVLTVFAVPQTQQPAQSPDVPSPVRSEVVRSFSIDADSTVDSHLGPVLSIEIEIQRASEAIEKLYRDVFTELQTIRQEEGVFNE
jgi:hypothetical protein